MSKRFDSAEMREPQSESWELAVAALEDPQEVLSGSRPLRLHELTDRQFADCDASQPLCFSGCGTPVDEPGDYCSEHCERRASRLADQAAEAIYG